MAYELDEKQFPLERRFKATVATLNQYLSTYNLAMHEKFGDRGIELIAEIWAKMADRFFLGSFERLGFKGNGPRDIAEWFAKSDAIVGYETEFFELPDGRAGFRVTNCPWYDAPSAAGARICSEGVIAFERRAAELLNPNLRVSLGKFFHCGDGCCEYIFELSQDQPEPNRSENRP